MIRKENKDKELKLETKSSELFIDSGGSSEDFCSSLIYEPANISEAEIGSFYTVGEIRSESKNCSYLINSLSSIIKKELYRNSKRPPIDSFEAALAKANAYLADIASQRIVEWIGNLHMVCALFSKSELHIAHTGGAKILLVRNGSITNIAENAAENSTPPFPSKTFTNITSGPIFKEDKIVLATACLFNMLSLEELRHSISGISCVKAVENLGEISEMDDDAQTSSVIIIDLAEKGSEASANLEMDDKNIQAEKAAYSYTPEYAGKLSLENIIGEIPISCNDSEAEGGKKIENLDKSGFQDISNSDIQSKINLNGTKNLFKKKSLLFFKFSQKLINLSLTAAKFIGKKSILLFSKLKKENPPAGREEKNKLSADTRKKEFEDLKNPEKNTSQFAKNLEELAGISECGFDAQNNEIKPRVIIHTKKQEEISSGGKPQKKIWVSFAIIKKTARIAIPVLIIAAGIAGTFFLQKKDKPISDDIPAKINSIIYQGYIQQARQKEQDAETALIYKDEPKARELLHAAAELIEKSADLGASQDEIAQIKSSLQAQIDQLDKITAIPSPFLICKIADFIDSFEGERILNEKNFTVLGKDLRTAEIDSAKYKAEIGNEYNLDPETLNSSIADFDIYSGLIYLLSPQENQIFKKSSGDKSAWIKQSGIDLSKAVSLSIDGSIYVLNSDRTIMKFTSGKLKNTVDIGSLSESPKKIYASEESDKLIILDSQAKKVIALDKQGSLIAQYKSDKFNNLKDAFIDFKTGSIYILNGNEIYRIDG